MAAPESDPEQDTRVTAGPAASKRALPWEVSGSTTLDAPRSSPMADGLEEGSLVGRFVVLERIGAGSMGVVFRAYDPRLAREVALKCLKSRDLGAEHRDRLTREAMAMAKLSHPNVVSVFDVLEPQPGEVVLAMEYVPGVNLRRWLSLRERPWQEVLRMLVAAGEGLAAAHAQGLLHRDFKPSNVLVSEDERPRVTDFGLAKLEGGVEPSMSSWRPHERSPEGPLSSLVPQLSLDSLGGDGDGPLTSTGAVLGTPAYMAPEQCSDRGVDARADQYAFCSSLWHALTGSLPFAAAGSVLYAIMDAKEEGPPPWPRDHPLPRRLVAAITRGMAPNPVDRWPNMPALLEQLRWDPRARRRRWLAILAGAVTLTASGVALSSFQSQRVEPCTGAEARLVGVWDATQREAARTAITSAGVAYGAATWDHIAPRLDDYASAWDRMHRDACEATAVRGDQSAEVMDLRMACLERTRIALRAATGRLVEADAEAVEHAHDLVDGLPSIERCADVEALRSGVEPPTAADAEAVREAREALAEARVLGEIGKVAPAQAAVARADAALRASGYAPARTELALVQGLVEAMAGEHAAADERLRDALAQAARHGQWDELEEAATELLLIVGRSRGLDAEGLRYAELARGLAERSGDARRLAKVHGMLGVVLKAQGRYAEAEAEYRAAIAGLEQALPGDHAETAKARGNLAAVLHLQGHSAEAATQMRAVVDTLERSLGVLHPEVLSARNNLAVIVLAQGRLPEAEAEFRAVVERRTALLGPGHEGVATARDNLANVLRAQGRLPEAEAEHRAALEIRLALFGPIHPAVATSHNNLGAALQAQNELEAAEVSLRAAVDVWAQMQGDEHPSTALARYNLGGVLMLLERPAEAAEQLERAWSTRSAATTPASDRARTAFSLARATMEARGDRARALELAELAAATYAELPPETADKYAKERQTLREWLAEHRPARARPAGPRHDGPR